MFLHVPICLRRESAGDTIASEDGDGNCYCLHCSANNRWLAEKRIAWLYSRKIPEIAEELSPVFSAVSGVIYFSDQEAESRWEPVAGAGVMDNSGGPERLVAASWRDLKLRMSPMTSWLSRAYWLARRVRA